MTAAAPAALASTWGGAAELLARLDAVARDGGHALVKIDGGRGGRAVYTVLLAGGRLGDAHFRRDGDDLPRLLEEALAHWAQHAAPAAGV